MKNFVLAYQFGCDFDIYMEEICAASPLEMLKCRFQDVKDCETYEEAERLLNESDISVNYMEI